MGIRHYQDVVGVVQMYDDSISFFQFFQDLSNAIDFAPVDWVMLLIFLGAVTWILYERRQKVTNSEAGTDSIPLETVPDPDEKAVTQNPGNHAVVIRLIVKAETVNEVETLFSNYINAASHHVGYEIEVVAVYYWKKNQLLKGDERGKWFNRGRDEIQRRHNLTRDEFTRVLSDTAEKYPELLDDW